MTAVEVLPLTADEQAALTTCEATIRSGLQTFVDVGRSLARIRDDRLYRQTHTTFENYCGMEFGLTRKRAYDLMGASDIIDALAEINGETDYNDEGVSPIGDTPVPATESQARELSGLDGPTAAEVMREAAASSDKITAKVIEEARKRIAPKPVEPVKVTETHTEKTEAWVQPDTGEMLDSPPAVEPDPLADYLSNDAGMKRANYQAALAKAIKAAGALPGQFSVASVAENADPEQIESLTELVKSLNNFVGSVRKQRYSALRLVNQS